MLPEAEQWSAAEVGRFIAASAGDPLGLLFRVVVLTGERRGEAVGFRTSKRRVWLDAETLRLLRERCETQKLERQFHGEAWQDNDLVFCRDGGTRPLQPPRGCPVPPGRRGRRPPRQRGRIMNECSPAVPRRAGSAGPRQPAGCTIPGVCACQRRVRDSNPGGRVNALAVFKTAAIGH
jgi:hypothetical protein